jgi:UrcA family protein
MTICKCAALTAGLLLIQASAAIGQPIVVQGDPMPTATVSYADLDLGTAAGRTRLDSRIRRAAKSLCLDEGVRDLADRLDQKSCMNFAVASARPQIEQAIVMAGRSPLPGSKTIVLAAR